MAKRGFVTVVAPTYCDLTVFLDDGSSYGVTVDEDKAGDPVVMAEALGHLSKMIKELNGKG